jgi:hypothetical protein
MEESKKEWGSELVGGNFLKKMLAKPASLLLVLFGWAQFLNYFRFYFVRLVPFSYDTCKTLQYLSNGLIILVLLFILDYLYVHRSWFRKPLTKTLLTIWVSWFVGMVLTNLIQQNVLTHIVFELQHALFMLLTAFAIIVTGSVIRNRWMLAGGVLFALLAFGASYLVLKNQMLLEAIGWLVGFVVPGHLMLVSRKN